MRGDSAISVCGACGRRLFPPRLLCPACGGASWSRDPAGSGTVEEVTTVRADGDDAVLLASVRLDTGPVVVAGVDAETRPGDRVELTAGDRVLARRSTRGSMD